MILIMILRIILYVCLVYTSRAHNQYKCLTGSMIDVQSWVDEHGNLTAYIEVQSTIDLSTKSNAVPLLQQQMSTFRSQRRIRFLSMAKCKLNRVPVIFDMQDSTGRKLCTTVEYMTLYGNQFADLSSPLDTQHDIKMNASNAREVTLVFGYGRQSSKLWSSGFQKVTFPRLLELDLRKCSIQILNSADFKGMSQLTALYLGENSIFHINTNAFTSLTKLVHLDLSRNGYEENGILKTLLFGSKNVFRGLRELRSLDLSGTKLSQNNIDVFRSLGKQMKRLSLCATGVRLTDAIFNGTSIRYLDLTGNHGVLSKDKSLAGIEKTLEVLYADKVGLYNFDIFQNFEKLKILKLSNNEINHLYEDVTKTLTNVQVLDLDGNKITTWFVPVFSSMPNLIYLSLRKNNINLISQNMMYDFQNISFVGLSGNFMVCNCYSRELYELALRNERGQKILFPEYDTVNTNFSFHTGFADYNAILRKRSIMTNTCVSDDCQSSDTEVDGEFVLLDYDENVYECLLESGGRLVEISQVKSCSQYQRDYIENEIAKSYAKLIGIMVTIGILAPVLVFGFVYRRNFRYFCIMMRNSAMLSLINKNEGFYDTTIFNYDVFVSYCNEDRAWVLDHLLPRVERDCNISVCLHERDFQVGLSILENIVSCMDRSRFIMLIISQRFLLSQWCQFEMHLAQHRLLETRREDLILILLEDIPRRLRPNTLHYLMVTKTYIVWPKEESERTQFWRRLTRCLVTPKVKQNENVSLA